jgi:hypothetical protein
MCGAVAEYAVYLGISAGGQAAGWPGMWPLGAMAIAAVAVLRTLRACLDSGRSANPAPPDPARPDSGAGSSARWPFSAIPVQAAAADQPAAGWGEAGAEPARGPAPGARLARRVPAGAEPARGPAPGARVAGQDVAGADAPGTDAPGWAAAGPSEYLAAEAAPGAAGPSGYLAAEAAPGATGPASPDPGAARWLPVASVMLRLRAALAVPRAGRLLLAAVALLVHGPRVALAAVLACAAVPAWRAVRRYRRATGKRPRAGTARPDPATVVALRDDGALVRWAGRMVRGNLPPLPGAVAGLAGTALLAAVGMNNVLGLVKLAPPVVMLLAAPGAGHRHDGRSDWLVPAIMQAGQYLYLGVLGQASGVPGPLIAVLFALTGLRSAVAAAAPGPDRPGGGALGWEGRMFCCGLAAMAGLATAGFALIACYLAVWTGRRILAGYLAAREA